MPIEIIRNDITRMYVDAIVNPTDTDLSGSGGVDAIIHSVAGCKLMEECRTLGGCEIGQAKLTQGYNLPCKYVIHTAGPIWRGGNNNEAELLASCYRSSLHLANQHVCLSIAFPLISSGTFQYPKDEALKIAVATIREFLDEHDMLVYLVVYDKNSYLASNELFSNVKQYIDDNYIEKHLYDRSSSNEFEFDEGDTSSCAKYIAVSDDQPIVGHSHTDFSLRGKNDCSTNDSFGSFSVKNTSLDDALKHIDESFSQMLVRKIDEQQLKDSVCYRKANVDRRLFSKIRSDIQYKPSKRTAVAFAIALELSLEETRDLLFKAGYALSRSSKFDIIIEYAISNRIFDIDIVNQILFDYDQVLLGG